MQQNLARTIFLPGLPRSSCTTATHEQCSEELNKFIFVKSDRGQLPAPSRGKNSLWENIPESAMRNKKNTTHTHTVSGAVQGLYLLELQGNQPVNHHISKCTSLINHHIHSFMARVNWCMTDSLRLCSLFAISQVGLKERFHTKKKWSGDVTSCVHTQQRPHVVSLWKEQAMCYCVFSRRRRREKKKRN